MVTMRKLLALFLLLGIPACSGSIETRISSAGAEKIGSLEYQLAEQGANQQNADHLLAWQLLAEALKGRSVQQTASAPIMLQVTLSKRPANLGLTIGEGDGAKNIATPKKNKPLQSCKDEEYRLGIRFFKISDGSLLYSGDAAEYHCKASLSEALPAMVSAIINDMDGPRGDKIRLRRGKD
jgi:hypothetical protein